MRGVIMYAPGDVRVEDREKPTIVEPTDAIIRVTSACICGSDLWPYRGAEDAEWPVPWATSTSASSRRSARRYGTSPSATSSSGRSSPPTTPARSAGPGTRPTASTGSPVPRPVPSPSTCACRSPTAP